MDENRPGISSLRAELETIPSDTDKVQLASVIQPWLEKVASLESDAEANALVRHGMKEHFGLAERDLVSYERDLRRLRAQQPQNGSTDPVAEMSEEIKQDAMQLLKSPGLLDQVAEHLTLLGIAGEPKTKQFTYLAYTSRKMSQPISLEIRGPSGVGKSFVAKTVAKLMPTEDVQEFTRITGKFIEYLPADALKHKILLVMERPGGEAAEYSLRMMTDDTDSGIELGYLRKGVDSGQYEPVQKRVEGPVMLVQTSTALNANEENDSRRFNIYLDASEEHRTGNVHPAVRRSALPHLGPSDEEVQAVVELHQNAQRLLQSVDVAIPYADLIEFPTRQTRSTRDLKRFISCIKASALLCQYQRERCRIKGKEYIVATMEDYRVAYRLAGDVLRDTFRELNPDSTRLLEASKALDEEFTRKDLEDTLGWDRSRVHRAIKPLVGGGYLTEENWSTVYRYRIVCEDGGDGVLTGVLTPEEMEEKMEANIEKIDPVYLS